MLETIELQIWGGGGLQKKKNKNSMKGQKDIEKISRKRKASCRSLKAN